MLFYKVTGIMEANEAPEEDRRVRRENQRKIEMKSEEFNRNHSSNSFYFISEIDNTVVTAGVIADNKNKVESDLAEFFKYLDLTLKDVSINEITFNGIENLLGAATDWITLKMTMTSWNASALTKSPADADAELHLEIISLKIAPRKRFTNRRGSTC